MYENVLFNNSLIYFQIIVLAFFSSFEEVTEVVSVCAIQFVIKEFMFAHFSSEIY